MSEEQLITVPRKLLDKIGTFNGMIKYNSRYLPLLKSENHVVKPRSRAETDPTFKQLVVYLILRNDRKNYLAYSRSPKSGDSRLHNKFSIGFGGHVNIDDKEPIKAVKRELAEELIITPGGAALISLDGFINDDTDEIGKVHFGLVYSIDIIPEAEKTIKANDPNISDLRWVSADVVETNYATLEGWSRHVIRFLTRKPADYVYAEQFVLPLK